MLNDPCSSEMLLGCSKQEDLEYRDTDRDG
jgi:hypothetical protein